MTGRAARLAPLVLTLAVVVAVTGAVSALFVDEDTGAAGDTTTSAPAGATDSTAAGGPAGSPSTAGPTPVADLATLLLDLSPQGYELQPVEPTVTGPLTIEDEATIDGVEDPVALQGLTELGYQRGYVNRWIRPGEVIVLNGVHECATPDGATGMVDADVGYYQEQAAVAFEVPGIPGAVGYSYDTNPEAPGELHNIEFTAGSRMYAIHVSGPAGSVELAVELAQAQFALVPP